MPSMYPSSLYHHPRGLLSPSIFYPISLPIFTFFFSCIVAEVLSLVERINSLLTSVPSKERSFHRAGDGAYYSLYLLPNRVLIRMYRHLNIIVCLEEKSKTVRWMIYPLSYFYSRRAAILSSCSNRIIVSVHQTLFRLRVLRGGWKTQSGFHPFIFTLSCPRS